MILTAFLIPPLILCAVLALGRYEEALLDPHSEPAPGANRPPGRHLRAVPAPEAHGAPAGPKHAHHRRPGRRHAA
ncbi:hypothetical protein OG429_01115 [Streptomyces sp. NBC_00190]|uniref:hypothetical protein n=1 Tax=Streptomyces sp. NBC_00190 TaxID=2903634 RepID=UPI002E2DECFB|nr:hypothetical protein [Streptomyces sp. NBC_00190]